MCGGEAVLPLATYLYPGDRVRVTDFRGRISREDLARLGKMFRNRDVFRTHDPAFAIFRSDVNVAEVDADDLLELEGAIDEASQAYEKRERIKVAVVATNPSVLSEMRLWRELTKPASRYSYIYQPFESFEEAVSWHGLDPHWAERIRTLQGFEEVG